MGIFDRAKGTTMKKLKDEKELIKKAIALGMKYGEDRGVVEFEATDSANEKIEYIYRLLVHDKVIAPLPEDVPEMLLARPTPSAVTSGTVMVDVVTPPES